MNKTIFMQKTHLRGPITISTGWTRSLETHSSYMFIMRYCQLLVWVNYQETQFATNHRRYCFVRTMFSGSQSKKRNNCVTLAAIGLKPRPVNTCSSMVLLIEGDMNVLSPHVIHSLTGIVRNTSCMALYVSKISIFAFR